ncbi:MAG: hypothetical protein BGP01_02580 [Paludibacter sp. 47-17]|nr:MAG: hypothetical protein BGP01_02580 [Paludibacter sp. 47-17]
MTSKQRIYIAVTSDLTTDQRVLKIAGSFHRKGWDVYLIGRLLPASQPVHTSFRHLRMRLLFNTGALFYAEYNFRLFLQLLTGRYDTVYANDTDTLAAGYLASRIRRKQLIFDAHELFPEVPELHDRPFVKSVWQKLEDRIVPRLTKSVTVCDSIAEYYRNRYGITMQVVRNVPYLRTSTDKIALPVPPGKKIILYQGALNTGRGLEWVIEAMPLVNNAVLYIIGDGDIGHLLKKRTAELGLNEKVIFHGKVPARELHRYTASAHIGLCLLENKGLSYYYALPNRIFDYMHAGVPVLSSPFPEIKKIVETYNTGVLTSDYSPEGLAATLNSMLNREFPTAHFSTVSENFCWEKEEELLFKLI